MNKLFLLLALVALPALFIGCGAEEAPANDTTEDVDVVEDVDVDVDADVEATEATVTIENGLGSWTVWYAYCDASDAPWGEDRLGTELLEPGESISFEVEAGISYDLKVIDEDDDEYILWDVYVDADGFEWVVELEDMVSSTSAPIESAEGDAPITFVNELGDWTIWYAYGDPSDGPWGEDRLGTELLEPGEEITFYVPAGDTYDFKVEDEDGDTYTLWGIDVAEDGFYWEITLEDMD